MNSLGRLAAMSRHEIYTRGRQAASKHRDVLLHRLGIDSCRTPGDAELGLAGGLDCDGILETLRRRLPEEAETIVARAARVIDGHFDLLGYTDLEFGSEIDWSFDPVNNRRVPAAPWPSIDFLNFETAGDHKVIWELNRHQFLVTLAKAYRLTGDKRFATSLKDLWYAWRRANPYPLGANWASTLEVAFRAMSWMWVSLMLEGTAAATEEFTRSLARETARAGWYIERYLSTYFSPNTHLLGEAVALFLIGVRYPGLREAARWRKTGWRIVVEQSRKQVRADGLHFEQSTYYHVYALDLFLHARAGAGQAGADLDPAIRPMLAALEALSQAGALPRFGDDDGGRLFDPSRNRAVHMLDPLSTGAALFGDARFKAASPGLIEETLWLLGPSSAAAFDAIPALARQARSVALESSGVYASTSPGPPVAQLFIDAGEQGALAAGHGHADALSIQLAAVGRLWLTDPGTFVYMGQEPARQAFRGTRAHNTMTVDGLDQADPRGPFAWGPRPRVTVRRWESQEASDLFEGEHSGYARLSDPVTHRRWVLRFGAGLWLVRDVAEGPGTHDLEIAWHFAPEASVSILGETVVACVGDRALALVPSADEAWERRLEMGEYSPAYGLRISAPVVRWKTRAALPAEFAVVLGFGADAARARLKRRAAGEPGSVDYEYSSEDARCAFHFSVGGVRWER